EHALLEHDSVRVDMCGLEARDNAIHHWPDVDAFRGLALARGAKLGIGCDAVISGERDRNARRVAQLVERVDEDAEIAIEPHDLVVQLARIGTKAVSDGVRRRERYGENVGLWSGAQSHSIHAGQRSLCDQRVHRWKLGE